MTQIREIQYRGSLKSCNYACSYCPFAKRPGSRRELEKDEAALRRLVSGLSEHSSAFEGKLGILIVPYGEALIHSYYWKEMAALSRLFFVEAVGAQTNLSFQQERCLELYEKEGGDIRKLRIWGTFHPEMEQPQVFAEKCRYLSARGVRLSVGAVGNPAAIADIRELAALLPEDIYLWINRMDGLGRPCTAEEKRAFLTLDPWFFREFHWPKADGSLCKSRLFLETDGKRGRCNLSASLALKGEGISGQEEAVCQRKRCTCYLAASGRSDFLGRGVFGPYPQFRIPEPVKAWFFDVDGTLAEEGEAVTEETALWLRGLPGRKFLATSLPVEEAGKRCRRIWDCLDGGVFSSGACVMLKKKGKNAGEESSLSLQEDTGFFVEQWAARKGVRSYLYRRKGRLLKAAARLPGQGNREKSIKEQEKAAEELRQALAEAGIEDVRVFAEHGRIQAVNGNASKEAGAELLLSWINISFEECAAAGDSSEDAALLLKCRVALSGQEMRDIRTQLSRLSEEQ